MKFNAEKKLTEVANYLMSDKFKGAMFSIAPLKNLPPSVRRKIGGYGYSVNAMMFFSLAILNNLLEKFTVDNEKFTLQIEEALRDPQAQIDKYDAHQKACDKDPTLMRGLYSNPYMKKTPHTTGSAVDLIRLVPNYADVIKGAKAHPHTKDLMKYGLTDMIKENLDPGGGIKELHDLGRENTIEENPDPFGEFIPREPVNLQAEKVAKYFKNYNGNHEWEQQIRDYQFQILKDYNPKLPKGERKSVAEMRVEALKNADKEIVGIASNIHFTTHAALTPAGLADPKAVEALGNNRLLTQVVSTVPFMTPINDEYWHIQLASYFFDIGVDFPLLFKKDFEAQDPVKVGALSNELMTLAADLFDRDIYNQTEIIPGRRIDNFSDKSKGNKIEIGSVNYLAEKLQAIAERHGMTMQWNQSNSR